MTPLIAGEWWKLAWVWLANPGHRSPPVKRSLFRSSLRTAIVGLALGVGALSLTLSIVNGFESALAEGVARTVGDVAWYSGWAAEPKMLAALRPLPEGFERGEMFWATQGLVVGPKGGRGLQIEGRRAVFPADRGGVQAAADQQEGTLEPRVTLGKPLADMIGAAPGDKVRLLMPGILRAAVPARIEAVVSHGMHEMDSRFAVVRDEDLRPWLVSRDPEAYRRRPGDFQGIRFFLSDDYASGHRLDRIETWTKGLRKNLESAGLKDPTLRTWQELRHNLFGAVSNDKRVLLLVVGLLTVVAALNVAATLVVLFLERDREMAVLRALGLSRRAFIAWTSLQGLVIGVMASALGLVLARLMGFVLQRLPIAKLPSEIYNISELPLRFDAKEQIVVFAFGLFCSWSVALALGARMSSTPYLEVLSHRR